MQLNTELEQVLLKYQDQLKMSNADIADMIIKGEISEIKTFQLNNNITLHLDLTTYFMFIGGLDGWKEPIFAWGMSSIPLKDLQFEYDLATEVGTDSPKYWPIGFIPFLRDGSGSYVVLNCISSSPTYGAVYDMTEGVGCNMIAPSLKVFIEGARKELEIGLRVYNEDKQYPDYPNYDTYLKDCLNIYGHTSYFIRAGGRMSEQIEDWN